MSKLIQKNIIGTLNMNLATQLADKELLKSKCLVQFTNISSNILFKIFPLTLFVKEQ